MSLLLECVDVGKQYRLNIADAEIKILKALNKVSFSLHEGDRLGLVGLNGSGKSTLLKIIGGITRPSTGRVEIYRGVHSLSSFDSILHQDLTGRENARFQLKLMDTPKKQMSLAIDEIIEFSDLQAFIDQPVKSYSSGMMLRLSVSILKTIKPEILLLDEALAVGDMVFREKVNKMMAEYFNTVSGIIMASHQLSEISQYCNRCLVLNKGTVDFIGNVTEALNYYDNANSFFSDTLAETSSATIEVITYNSSDAVFTVSQEIEITMVVKKKVAEDEIIPAIYISSVFGNILTDSPRFRSSFKLADMGTGFYIYKVVIPGDFFNIGIYHLSIILGNINQIILEAKNISKFTVKPDSWEENMDWKIPTYFPVRPKLKWSASYKEEWSR
jgi:ABC-type polysaccharide/polyol phosphate transport system ATPase subunit